MMEEDEKILDLIIIACYADGTRELKTSVQDPEEVYQILQEVADEVYDYGLDENSCTMH